jgi:protein NrfD
MILYLFLSHLAIGIVFTLAFVSRDAGVKFFRFNAGLAAILLAIALALRPGGATGPALAALVATEGLLVFYWATIGRMLTRFRTAILAAAVMAGALAVTLQALALAVPDTAPMRLLVSASFISSTLFLGGACTAMVLGHWYLVIPSLEIRHLQSIVKVHIVSMIVRVAVVGAAVYAGLVLWQAGSGDGAFDFRRYVTSLDGVFFWQRVLFGLAGPALLSYLIWETAKIRSTQSATGILYVDFFTVVVGEALAKYLMLATRVPL